MRASWDIWCSPTRTKIIEDCHRICNQALNLGICLKFEIFCSNGPTYQEAARTTVQADPWCAGQVEHFITSMITASFPSQLSHLHPYIARRSCGTIERRCQRRPRLLQQSCLEIPPSNGQSYTSQRSVSANISKQKVAKNQ
jgi:hypothetical protein